ncbi:hypothetical protein RND71_011602 [Anisodus tanguticus]|uniref:Prolyl 4-hydroxylase alpha subunit domain-containing protein n=1 Tax=Anisodus tanguticus TaxID=243964 RepID=A0AAE1VPZ1_9SOLA|nr:hypothetical protein RND71_011602 [Anisodus tanguticus]
MKSRAGLFGSTLVSHQDVQVPTVRPRPRVLESDPLPNGETGEHSLTSIPFQEEDGGGRSSAIGMQLSTIIIIAIAVNGHFSFLNLSLKLVLSWFPRALYFPNFATIEQCQGIITMAKAELKPSSLALRKGETAENTKGIRTRSIGHHELGVCIAAYTFSTFLEDKAVHELLDRSLLPRLVLTRSYKFLLELYTFALFPSSGMFISASEDKTGILDLIEEKIAKATMVPRTHGEAFNVLRYEIGQSYHSHYDAFNPSQYGPQKSQRSGQNIDANYDFRKCIGLKVKPRRGDGLLFYSLFPNGTIDPTSLHGSCPVIRGEKWVATKWIRNQQLDE